MKQEKKESKYRKCWLDHFLVYWKFLIWKTPVWPSWTRGTKFVLSINDEFLIQIGTNLGRN